MDSAAGSGVSRRVLRFPSGWAADSRPRTLREWTAADTWDLVHWRRRTAAAAVALSLSIAGMLCLWTGVMEVMRQSGLADKLSALLSPVLRRLYPQAARDTQVMDAISANVSANLLGLGSAATPLGLEAARGLARRSPGVASDSLCMLIVCNTASIQLIPTTVASVRAAQGCAAPFDILPAVWLASALSVGVGITACKIFARIWR